jgi:hypothetical protein
MSQTKAKMNSDSFSHILADPRNREKVSKLLDKLEQMIAFDPEWYAARGKHFQMHSLGVAFPDPASARIVLGIPKIELCFSCDTFPQKYVTGLCDNCHIIVTHADDEAATKETIKALSILLFGETKR